MPYILKIDPEKPDVALVNEIIRILKAGGVIAYPTETFYGLGCDGQNEKAIEKIYQIKGRSFQSPLSVICGVIGDVVNLTEDITPAANTLITTFWPGPLTLVFAASPKVLPRLTAYTGKIGIRISNHPLAARIAEQLAGPITATSANISGEKESISADEVVKGLGDKLDIIIDGGPTPGGKGSTIMDMTVNPPALLREGVIPFIDIENVLHVLP